ncbi:MAG: DUF4040 domain-containing protein [Candidatus Omnitrophica bacterium]|nr:DUF4040 domain-containing protein [Candidatus Omnitrophota bacterium]
MMIELYILMFLMIIGSIIALEVKDMLSGIILVGTVGVCLSIGFILLKAPELAMTQLIMEILLVIILIQATISKDVRFISSKKELGLVLVVIGGLAVFINIADKVINNLPIFGKPILWVSQTYLSDVLKNENAANIVSKISLDYRVYDTFGAMLALFTAVIGVLAIGSQRAQEKD